MVLYLSAHLGSRAPSPAPPRSAAPALAAAECPSAFHSHRCWTSTFLSEQRHFDSRACFQGKLFTLSFSSWTEQYVVLLEKIHFRRCLKFITMRSNLLPPPSMEEALTVGRLVWFHTLSFHNWYVINSNIAFDARAPDPFKYELRRNQEAADQRVMNGKPSAAFCIAINCTGGLGVTYKHFPSCRKNTTELTCTGKVNTEDVGAMEAFALQNELKNSRAARRLPSCLPHVSSSASPLCSNCNVFM